MVTIAKRPAPTADAAGGKSSIVFPAAPRLNYQRVLADTTAESKSSVKDDMKQGKMFLDATTKLINTQNPIVR
jgi:hypothetical protein